ncbi:MAG: cytochrome c-type biogenesis protein CcmH [Gammaproteobacteria bacterium]|jgi:cytochrome c-type biogenesis protein CcmH|nr:cytochrome c-type biogenesis protein CcmH [Gammaproteobacteria bacterium]|tara:strand:+ start:26776 stop:27225 length:450 start_codon:yes stop_codon:yes gene_type:complete
MSRAFILILGLWIGLAEAQIVTVAPEYQQRYNSLLHELRCLVCQNQTLADSGSGLADDLRLEVKRMLEEGRSNEQIYTFMSDRYGDFVLYNPPVKPRTWLLWFGPFILLLAGLIGIRQVVRSNNKTAKSSALTDAEKRQVNAVIKDRDD